MRPFHLAFPVDNLADTEFFYVNVLGCSIGRRTERSINFNFHGHQIVAHLVNTMPDQTDNGRVDGQKVPPFHFGLVMEYTQWHTFRDELESKGVEVLDVVDQCQFIDHIPRRPEDTYKKSTALTSSA